MPVLQMRKPRLREIVNWPSIAQQEGGGNWGSNSQACSLLWSSAPMATTVLIKKRKCKMHPLQDTPLSRPQIHT